MKDLLDYSRNKLAVTIHLSQQGRVRLRFPDLRIIEGTTASWLQRVRSKATEIRMQCVFQRGPAGPSSPEAVSSHHISAAETWDS